MPADPVESRLAAARGPASDPPAPLVTALRERRRSRRIAALGGTLAASLALAVGVWASLRPHGEPTDTHFAAAEPREFVPTIRALWAANPAMDADTLRLPALGAAAAAEPMTVRSFDEVGG